MAYILSNIGMEKFPKLFSSVDREADREIEEKRSAYDNPDLDLDTMRTKFYQVLYFQGDHIKVVRWYLYIQTKYSNLVRYSRA
jgi:hypothetical protein